VLCAALVAAALFAFTGSSAAASPTLRLITEPNAGLTPIDQLLSEAKRSVDLVMYEFADPQAEALLAADAARGVRVRVLLNRNDEESANLTAYDYLARHGVAVHWASSRFALTHEKAAVIDDRTALVMTLNLVRSDYASTRDFAVVDTNPTDVAAIESVFSEDWANNPGPAPSGADLVWSPGAEDSLVSLIDSATHSLLIENEEMDDRYITAPLEAAAQRGVRVEVVMTRSSSWTSAFDALVRSGVLVRTYATTAPLYIHAKAIVADAAFPDARAFVGSQNFSIESLVYNRELGVITSQPAIVHGLASVIESDFAAATPWSS
jgi:cardiolipin synthase A/B